FDVRAEERTEDDIRASIEKSVAALQGGCPYKKNEKDPIVEFFAFKDAFVSGSEIQRVLTRYPLEVDDIVSTRQGVKHNIKSFKQGQLIFPLVAISNNKGDDSAPYVHSMSNKHAVVMQVGKERGANYQQIYYFEKDNCWKLIKIEDWSKSSPSEFAKKEWLSNFFPFIDSCLPRSLFFSVEKNESLNGLMEKRGYRNPKIEDIYATYSINEKFYGFDAEKLTIPAGNDFLYVVWVAVPASELASKIREATGKKINIYPYDEKGVQENSVAYLREVDGAHTLFTCHAEEDGISYNEED
ncbi:MAG: hypothetical protein PHX43_09660, partial [Alphaproteobacteria bacterium]|nr:hypothetical protein [Alphaproteobacteria bacterium]